MENSDTGLVTIKSTNNAESDEEDVSMDVWMGTDPFYDRFPWFRLIGRYVFVLKSYSNNFNKRL